MSETALKIASEPSDVQRARHRTKWGTPVSFISHHCIQFADVDPFGHMNTNHYLAYFTENRFIGHREVLHLDLKALSGFSIAPHIRKAEIEFIRPVYPDTKFVIESFLAGLGECHCSVESTMRSPAGAVYATCKFTIACVDKKAARAVPWPDEFICLYYIPNPEIRKGEQ